MKLQSINGQTVFPLTMHEGRGGYIKSTDISILIDGEHKHLFEVAKTSESEARAEFTKFLQEKTDGQRGRVDGEPLSD